MILKITHSRTALACFGALLLATPLAYSQTSARTVFTPSWATAPDRWRLTAPDMATEGDTVTPAIRALRNADLLPLLRMASPAATMIVDGDFSKPDIYPPADNGQNMVWVVATFTSFRVYDAAGTPAAPVLYTEVNLTVDTVISQPQTSSLTAGSLIDVVLFGGKLKTKDGSVHTFDFPRVPPKYGLEPNHRYILALWVRPHGLFSVHKKWDVTGGTVQVSSRFDEVHVQKGESQIVGLSVPSAINLIQSALSSR